jgi:hypothetical protein
LKVIFQHKKCYFYVKKTTEKVISQQKKVVLLRAVFQFSISSVTANAGEIETFTGVTVIRCRLNLQSGETAEITTTASVESRTLDASGAHAKATRVEFRSEATAEAPDNSVKVTPASSSITTALVAADPVMAEGLFV